MRYRFILLRQNVNTPSSIKLSTVTLNGGYITFIMHVTSNSKTNITPIIELLSSTLHQHTREHVTKLMPQNKPNSYFRIVICKFGYMKRPSRIYTFQVKTLIKSFRSKNIKSPRLIRTGLTAQFRRVTPQVTDFSIQDCFRTQCSTKSHIHELQPRDNMTPFFSSLKGRKNRAAPTFCIKNMQIFETQLCILRNKDLHITMLYWVMQSLKFNLYMPCDKLDYFFLYFHRSKIFF